MIDTEKFYSNDDYPAKNEYKKIWDKISQSLFSDQYHKKSFIDLRSFSIGVAFTTVVFLIALVSVNFVPKLFNDYKSEDVKINRTYSKVANELEKMLPDYISSLDKSERTRELLKTHLEELIYVNQAIKVYTSTFRNAENSTIEKERLLELYQLKIETINKIIQLKGEAWL